MAMRLFNARKLALELAEGSVSNRAKGHYLFAGFALWLLINVTGFASMSPLWTWMSLVEVAALLIVTLLGLQSAYDAAGGDDNPDFVVQFTCLYVPVSITTTLFFWGIYWGVVTGFREAITAVSESRMQFAINLGRIGSSVFGALVVLTSVVVQAVTFYRVTRLLALVRRGNAAEHRT